jgi:hypothetical protein
MKLFRGTLGLGKVSTRLVDAALLQPNLSVISGLRFVEAFAVSGRAPGERMRK